jgi:GGDEF domain-containing protein
VAVLSIRKYLNAYGTDNTNPLLRVSTVLLEGIAKSALAYDRQEYAEFRATLQHLAETLTTTQDPDEMMTVAGAACQALESYNRGAQRMEGAQTVELRCMIEMLSQTLVSLAQASGQSVQMLQSIRNQVESARQLDDIRILRARLGDSLKAISDEAKRQREQGVMILRHAKEAAECAAGNREDGAIDKVSGLPTAEKAEDQIAARLGPDSRHYAAVFVVDRVESVNLRYGRKAGDQVMQAYSCFMESKMAPSDELYRWRGPSFLMLLERSSSADAVRAELARLASTPQEHVLETDGGPVKISLGCAWTFVRLASCEIPGQVYQQIDRFVAEHGN